jgi:ubiquinone/menaquinone biosynthesis C-methylase UbiE
LGPGIDVLSKTTVARIAAERASGKPRALFAKERTMSAQSTEFILGHPEGEMDHLGILSRVFDKFTRRVFVEAGLRDGMRVLEIGSASGDVAMVAAEFVGPHGAVVGVEQSPEAVELATRHAAGRGLKNVTFVEAGLDENLPFGQEFDALVGRIVLMFLPQPAVTLRRLVRHVKPGGLVIFQEPDMSGAKSVPPVPTIETAAGLMRQMFAASGADSEIGPKLHGIYKAAGLPDPKMKVDGMIYGSEGDGPFLLAETLKAMLPGLEHLGLTAAEQVDAATFEDRARAELAASDATMSSPLLVSAWTPTST